MNRVTVNIQGIEYTLKGEESEEYLKGIGDSIDNLINQMLRANRKLNLTSAAILTSCNLMDEKIKLDRKTEYIKELESDYKKEKNNLLDELDKSKMDNDLLKKDFEILQNKKREDESLKDNEIKKLLSEVKLLQESIKQFKDDNETLSKTNKDLKFELQSYKYKVLDLQNKLFDNQMNKVKQRKEETSSVNNAPQNTAYKNTLKTKDDIDNVINEIKKDITNK